METIEKPGEGAITRHPVHEIQLTSLAALLAIPDRNERPLRTTIVNASIQIPSVQAQFRRQSSCRTAACPEDRLRSV